MTMLHTAGVQERSHTSTGAFAAAVDVEPQSILKAHSKDGHYCGVRPIKLPNRRLAWPVAEIEKLFSAPSNHSTMEA